MEKRAKVIAFAGIDGCGKSTQINLLYQALINQYQIFISKITYMPLNERNQSKLQDLLIDCRSGIEILKQTWEIWQKAQKDYDFIFCDRYLMCYLAYAYAYGFKNIELIRQMLFFIKNPDLTFYFNLDPTLALMRIDNRSKTHDKHENIQTLTKAQKGYAKLFPSMGKIITLDATQEPELINEKLIRTLQNQHFM